MTKEYIEREEALSAIKQAFEKGEGPSLYIKRIPAADVAPVRHGEWLNFYGDFSTAECELCAELERYEPESEATNWAEMPKYKGRDNENG